MDDRQQEMGEHGRGAQTPGRTRGEAEARAAWDSLTRGDVTDAVGWVRLGLRSSGLPAGVAIRPLPSGAWAVVLSRPLARVSQVGTVSAQVRTSRQLAALVDATVDDWTSHQTQSHQTQTSPNLSRRTFAQHVSQLGTSL